MKKKIIQTGMLSLVIALFITSAAAQQIPITLGIKTGIPSGAGSYGSKIKVVITFVHNNGRVQKLDSWLSDATLENGGFSSVTFPYSWGPGVLPQMKTLRLENHGTNSAWTGDNWYCDWVSVAYSPIKARFEFNRWINGGEWVELDNPDYREPVPAVSLEQQCAESVQDKVAWNKAGSTRWNPANVTNLCRGTTNPEGTISCFRAQIQRTDDWVQAIALCKAP